MQSNNLSSERLFYEEPSISELLKAIDDRKRKIWTEGLKGSSKAFLTYLLEEKLNRVFVIITPTMTDAHIFYNDLKFFLGEEDSNASSEHSKCLLYPPWDTFPFDTLSPSPNIISKRLEVLYSLATGFNPIIITTLPALIQRVITKGILEDAAEEMYIGQEVNRDRLVEKMVGGGYNHVSVVEAKGEYSVRGGIVDIFPPFFKNPVRLEFFGNELESVRYFDVTSQRSSNYLEKVTILPIREIVLNKTIADYAIKRIRKKANDYDLPRSIRDELSDEIRNSSTFPGIDFFLPFFYPKLDTFFDYLPQDAILIMSERWDIEKEQQRYEDEIEECYQRFLRQRGFFPEVSELYLTPHEIDSGLERFQIVLMERFDIQQPDETFIRFYTEGNENIRKESLQLKSDEGILGVFAEKIRTWLEDNHQIFLLCHTDSQAKRLYEILKDYDLPFILDSGASFQSQIKEINLHESLPKMRIQLGNLLSGFHWSNIKIIIVTEEEIFGERKRRQPKAKLDDDYRVSTFGDLKVDDYVVHLDHGVGLYLGLKKLEVDGVENDYILMEYMDGDKLYLPVTRLNLLQKYMGVKGHSPKLDKLGGRSWENKKKKVKESIKEMAEDLLKLYALRNVQKGFAFSKKDHYYREFEAAFQYEETPDQLDAIESVIRDMEDEKPMERLICGDVGFGKTEVALRASFKAVMDGKQVAVLVPTTVLAYQHYQTFLQRFKPYPVFIDMLSRFRTRQEQKTIINKLKDGEIDIVVGTHRLLQKDISFKNLGLLVIDEEHRFGVSHKEKLKKLRKLVDVITMTATPIPRTLYMSMMGVRDLSVINTPPEDRLAIKTYITKFDDNIIRRAALKEIERDGQIFFVHNRVESIPAMVSYMKKIVPEARVGVAHGQMDENDLEKVMFSFINKEINLLVCTTIIESGLDFPSANTIIINRAERLGLAQMYQLRGRVGRAKEQAYAYLLVPGKHLVSKDALKRLKALSELTELGSGLRLAAHDLEIRGAGNILGTSQSGHIATVGYDMYINLLERTIKELKGEEVTNEIQPEINIKIPAYIPEDYIRDTNQRLIAYKRLASITSDDEAENIKRELADRFGNIPLLVENLLDVVRTKNLLKRFLISSADYNGREIILSFDPNAETSLEKILQIIASNEERCRFSPDLKLTIPFRNGEWKSVLNEIKNVLK
ncbi:MAG: transcription-repair coupling factor [Pseudomonadota bacterium]